MYNKIDRRIKNLTNKYMKNQYLYQTWTIGGSGYAVLQDKLIMYNRMFNKDKNIPEDIPEEPTSSNLVCVYDIIDTSQETLIMSHYVGHAYTSMIVDGVEMDFDYYYQFDTEGLHTVEFIFDEEYKTELPEQGFDYVTRLVSITIPDSITSIPLRAISCDLLTEFKGKFASKDGKCLIVDGELIMGVKKGLTDYSIPDSVTVIGYNAFTGCSLTSVTIPDSVTTIEDSAFKNCSNLISVTIPNSVTSMDSYVFYHCDNLTNVYCKAVTPPTAGKYSMFPYSSDFKIYVPMESVESYKTAEYWSNYADVIVGYNF